MPILTPTTTFDKDALSCPRIASYEILPQSRFRRLGVLDGAPRYRLTAPHNTYWVNLAWAFDWHQMTIFRTWYEADLLSGARWFLIELPLGEAKMRTYQAHFVAEWSARALTDKHWDVTATLELREAPSHPLLSPVLDCDVVIAGEPATPSVDVFIAGTPSTPSADEVKPCPHTGLGT